MDGVTRYRSECGLLGDGGGGDGGSGGGGGGCKTEQSQYQLSFQGGSTSVGTVWHCD